MGFRCGSNGGMPERHSAVSLRNRMSIVRKSGRFVPRSRGLASGESCGDLTVGRDRRFQAALDTPPDTEGGPLREPLIRATDRATKHEIT